MHVRRSCVRSRGGYALLDIAVASVISLLLAAAFAPTVHDARLHGLDTGLAARVQLLRSSVRMYQCDHDGTSPDPGRIEEQLLGWTDPVGAANAAPSPTFTISPYLRQIPALPVGSRTGCRRIGPANAPSIGWTYAAGMVRPNALAGERDVRGVAYMDY
jgi:competence protein ComGC